ncbi:hypothetical protein [Peribacillus butanolivorans]
MIFDKEAVDDSEDYGKKRSAIESILEGRRVKKAEKNEVSNAKNGEKK